MSSCQPFPAEGPAGIADALRTVDCFALEATSSSFGRLFAPGGGLSTALTIILTLYIALLAINLLTGRSAIRLSMFTPRMLTLGLVLTFVTSWVAYQSVVWNLAVGAPDQIATVLVGSRGSATVLFAERLDALFMAIADAAGSATEQAAGATPQQIAAAASLASPVNLLWLASLLLVLGTVGVLVLCRIALAALLVLGPVFIVLALFDGTRGLFEGWLKSVAMFAFAPLLTVVMGSAMLLVLFPMVGGLAGGEVELQVAVTLFVAAVVYLALVAMVMKVAATLTSGWRLGRAAASAPVEDRADRTRVESSSSFESMERERSISPALSSDRVRATLASLHSVEPASLEPVRIAAGPAAVEVLPEGPGHSSHGLSHRHGLLLGNRTQPNSPFLSRELIR